MYKNVIGKKSKKVKNMVERGMVKRFAESIGDSHPIFIDEEYGRQSRYKKNIAPPTFPRVFDYGEINELYLPNVGLIHGEQTYHYERPLLVGETIYCFTEVADYYEKKASLGLLGFIVLKRYGEDAEGNTIFTEDQSIIITETIRKELSK
ncbi:MaoC family dehydratase N-terminal domain-containing protein [Oceanobacillus sp. Castelsardo]|uniref:MaoC family dehydratase N-terminal domain-containing protein n=1 Tax=Oceanobacillus sp. Castelsardo TaxID=1851204 RepID=UPI00083856DF|nr:MaoC family dehydratase N-terminal domain-containing protein [Oceanobacillus sp. Castelsardo]